MRLRYYAFASLSILAVSSSMAGVVNPRLKKKCDPRDTPTLSPIEIDQSKAISEDGSRVIFKFKSPPMNVVACPSRNRLKPKKVECLWWTFPRVTSRDFKPKNANIIELNTKNGYKNYFITRVTLYMPALHKFKNQERAPASLVYSIDSERSAKKGRVEVPITINNNARKNEVMSYIYDAYMMEATGNKRKYGAQAIKDVSDMMGKIKHNKRYRGVKNREGIAILSYVVPKHQGWYVYSGSDMCHPSQPVTWFIAKSGFSVKKDNLDKFKAIFTDGDSTREPELYRKSQPAKDKEIFYYH